MLPNDNDLNHQYLEEEPQGADEELESEISSDDSVEKQLHDQPFRVVYQTNNFLIPQLRDLVIEGENFNLRPEYQRRLRWSTKQKSLLIESLLLNVPVPPVFLYESDLASYEVMDGQQRLNAIKEFLENEFPLSGLQILSSLNGRRYSKLPPRVKRNLDRASISAIVLLQESQARIRKSGSERYFELRRFVFERLNTGGKRLSAQEVRNAVYGGKFNELIVQLSRDDTFTRIWGIPPYQEADPNDYYENPERQKNSLYRTMADCQLVLRFFALDTDAHIQGSMKSMLDKCMERNLDMNDEQARQAGKRYLDRLYFADELFDGRPFVQSPNSQRDRPLAGYYDGVMVALDRLWRSRARLLDQKSDVQKAYYGLVQREAKTGKLTGAANTSQDIKDRIDAFHQLFSSFLG